MNKKNKILVGCLALLLALSVGYALFSDTITINGTATAKGSFDVTADCTPGILSKLGTAEAFGWPKEGGYENDICTENDDVVSASVDFLYPGARRYFTVKLTNTGTIDAILNLNSISKKLKFCYSNDLNVEPSDSRCYEEEGYNGVGNAGESLASAYINFVAMSDDNNDVLSKEESNMYFDSQNNKITLPPNYSVYVITDYMVDVENSKGVLNAKLTSTLEFPFEQATN